MSADTSDDIKLVYIAHIGNKMGPGIYDLFGQTLAEWYLLGGADTYLTSRSG